MIGEDQVTVGQLAESIRQRLSELESEPPAGQPAEKQPPPGPRRLENPDDPVILISPRAGVIPPGGVTSPAQQLADTLQRPVVAPDTGYVITRDGSVLAVDAPPGATSFGQGWQPGHWTAFFPRPAPPSMRAMTQDDLDAVTELDADLYPGGEWTRGEFEDELVDPDTRRWLVTERAGQVTGYAGLSVDRDTDEDGHTRVVARVINMAVARDEQGHGIGTHLLRELLAEARRAGAEAIELLVPADRGHPVRRGASSCSRPISTATG